MNNMTIDYEIKLNTFNDEEVDIIETHLLNYNDDYEYEDDDVVIVHCKSETEYNDLYELIRRINER